MIVIKLREVKLAYERRTGTRLTYAQLEKLTGIAKRTLSAMGNTPGYNPSLEKLYSVCTALDALPGELLDLPEADKARIAASRRADISGSGIDQAAAGEVVGKNQKRKRGKSAKKKTQKKRAGGRGGKKKRAKRKAPAAARKKR